MKNILYRLRRSRTHHGIRDNSRKFRTRAYTKDLDQIHEDLKEGNVDKMKNQPIDADKTGLGQHYCVPCAYVQLLGFRKSKNFS
jgi:bud site selection protein 20